MVLLVEKLCHSPKVSKLDSHHHHHRRRRSRSRRHPQSEALSASLQAFQSIVSDCSNQLLSSNSKQGSEEFLSLTWIQRTLDLLSNVNKAFAKLVMDINYPMNKWEAPSVEEYLRYSLKALDLLNSINSSLSLLRRARLSISHALTLINTSSPPTAVIERLKESQHLKKRNKYLKVDGDLEEEEEEEEIRISTRSCNGKEWVVCQALMAMDSSFCEAAVMVRKWVLIKEVEEVNDEAAKLVVSVGAGESCNDCERRKELERKLEGMEREVDVMGKKADGLFSEILGGRAELLDALRWRKEV